MCAHNHRYSARPGREICLDCGNWAEVPLPSDWRVVESAGGPISEFVIQVEEMLRIPVDFRHGTAARNN